MLVVTVGPDFDGSTVAGGIDLISQTAASWEGGVWGWESQKGRGCLFYRAVLCSAACNYPPPSTQEVQTPSDSLSEILKKRKANTGTEKQGR